MIAFNCILSQVQGNQKLGEEYKFTDYHSRGVYAEERDNVHLQPVLNSWSHHSTGYKAPYGN